MARAPFRWRARRSIDLLRKPWDNASAAIRTRLHPLELRTRGGQRRGQPLVSVIVPIYRVEDYVEQTLRSLAAQTYQNLEIILVNDGTPDQSMQRARKVDLGNRRVKVIHQPNRGLGAARNRGVEYAVGEYLTFVDSDDTLPPRAIELLVARAQQSGADVAVGSMTRFNSKRRWNSEWTARVHDRDRHLSRAEEFPAVLRNFYSCGKIIRRSFWASERARFREGVSYEDQPLITLLLLHARGIDVITEPVYEYRSREDKSSISQQVHTLGDLTFRVEAWDLTIAALANEAAEHPRGRCAWFLELANTHLHWYLRSPNIQDDRFWTSLRDFVARMDAAMPEEVWRSVSPLRRLALQYVREDRRDLLLEFQKRGGYSPGAFPIEVHEATAVQQIPADLLPGRAFPEEERVIPQDRLRVRHRVDRLEWRRAGVASALVIEGHAYIRGIGLESGPPGTYLDLVDASGRTVVSSRAEPTLFEPTDPEQAKRLLPYRNAGFRLEIEEGELPELTNDGELLIQVRVDVGGVRTAQPVTRRRGRAAPARLEAHALGDGRTVHVGFTGPGDQLKLRLDRPSGALGTSGSDLSAGGGEDHRNREQD